MAQHCRMKVEDNRQCNQYLYKCKHCNARGCDNQDCKNVSFDRTSGLCYACNKTSAREMAR